MRSAKSIVKKKGSDLYKITVSITNRGSNFQRIFDLKTSGMRLLKFADTALLITELSADRYAMQFEKLSPIEILQKVRGDFQDSGKGFSEEAQKKLFDYFGADKVMHHAEGFGLGLAACKLIIDAHEGQIKISNPTEGGALVQLILKIGS